MKKNIDLTQNRDFMKKEHICSLFKKQSFNMEGYIKKIFGEKYLWSFRDNHNYYPVNQLVYTGDKESRRIKKREESFTSGEYCDRCGRDLTRKKWYNVQGLCMECNSSLISETKNKPWD